MLNAQLVFPLIVVHVRLTVCGLRSSKGVTLCFGIISACLGFPDAMAKHNAVVTMEHARAAIEWNHWGMNKEVHDHNHCVPRRTRDAEEYYALAWHINILARNAYPRSCMNRFICDAWLARMSVASFDHIQEGMRILNPDDGFLCEHHVHHGRVRLKNSVCHDVLLHMVDSKHT